MWIWPLAVALLSLVVACVAIMQVKRNAREDKEQQQRLNQRIGVLENELSAMMDGAFGVASHLQKVETNLKHITQRQEQMQQRDMGNLPYNEAVRLASKGADVSELVEHCGLSRSEAELVEMLHKKSLPIVTDEHEVSEPKDVRTQTTDDFITAQENVPPAEQSEPVALQTAFELEHEHLPENEEESETVPVPVQEPHFESPSTKFHVELDNDDDESLPAGEFGSDEFQRALEQARAFHQHSSEPRSQQQTADVAPPSEKPVWPELESQPSQKTAPDDKH